MGENVKQFIAGGVGGMAAVFSGHPLGLEKNLAISYQGKVFIFSACLVRYKIVEVNFVDRSF